MAASGAYFGFGHDLERIIGLLLGEQLPDGGWNCEAERGSTRSSFNTTICVLEALLEYELADTAGMAGTTGWLASTSSEHSAEVTQVREARLRGQEYLIERRLFRRLSTGEVIDPAFTLFSFPTWWHYDVLRGPEYLRRAGVTPDKRMFEAIEVVRSKRDGHGRWPLENQHPGTMPVELDEEEGQASRWNTLHALRVLDWYSVRG